MCITVHAAPAVQSSGLLLHVWLDKDSSINILVTGFFHLSLTIRRTNVTNEAVTEHCTGHSGVCALLHFIEMVITEATTGVKKRHQTSFPNPFSQWCHKISQDVNYETLYVTKHSH